MKTSIGIDLIEISRFESTQISQTFLDKVYTPREIGDSELIPCKLAERFALKEACMKALGHGIQQGVWFTQIELWQLQDQEWHISLSGKSAEIKNQLGVIQISTSTASSKTLAVAVVIMAYA